LKENPNTLIIESGNLAYGIGVPPATYQLDTVAEVFRRLGYTAVGVGALDSKFGDQYFRIMREKGIPVVHADAEVPEGGYSYLIKVVNGIKVGIVSFGYVDPMRRDDIALEKRRYEAFVRVRRKSDLVILLDQANLFTPEWVKKNAYKYGMPDIVLAGGARVSMPEPEYIGTAMVLPTSSQGTYVNRVDIDFSGGERKIRFSRALMDSTVPEDPEIALLAKEYEEKLTISVTNSSSSTNQGGYISFQSCRGCHEAEYNQWKTTPHAFALKTLVDKKRTTQDCLPCHSEMYRRTKQITLTTDLLGGVECQTCHANVVPHPPGFKKKGDVAAIRATCVSCHTKDRSPEFQPSWYNRVKHKKN